MNIKGVDCEHCGKEIGNENYVVCFDGIKNKPVTFHSRCKPKMQMSDVQSNHHIGLTPGQFGMTGREL